MTHRLWREALSRRDLRLMCANARRRHTIDADALCAALAFHESEVEDQWLERHGPGCPPCSAADRRWHLRNTIATIRALRAATKLARPRD